MCDYCGQQANRAEEMLMELEQEAVAHPHPGQEMLPKEQQQREAVGQAVFTMFKAVVLRCVKTEAVGPQQLTELLGKVIQLAYNNELPPEGAVELLLALIKGLTPPDAEATPVASTVEQQAERLARAAVQHVERGRES